VKPPVTDVKAHTEPEPKHGDTRKAREIVDEADALFEEEDYGKAIGKYREAAVADPSYAKAYRGLYRAGAAGLDTKAAKVGAQMYLKVAPDAPDAPAVREWLKSAR
jgi:hypothetical protein